MGSDHFVSDSRNSINDGDDDIDSNKNVIYIPNYFKTLRQSLQGNYCDEKITVIIQINYKQEYRRYCVLTYRLNVKYIVSLVK